MATQRAVQERGQIRTQEPRRYRVIMHNDDFTTMEFVVSVLMRVFHKDAVTAEAIMLKVHRQGCATVGEYAYDIALSKVKLAMAMAKEEGFPFRMTIEEV